MRGAPRASTLAGVRSAALRAFFLLLVAGALPARAEQRLPSCEELDRLWVARYYRAIRPDWGAHHLDCARPVAALGMTATRDMATALAAYYLERTVWTAQPYFQPVAGWGEVTAPPANMLEWVSSRSRGLMGDPQTRDKNGRKVDVAYFDAIEGKIHLSPRNFMFESKLPEDEARQRRGVGLAAQLIHESRHAGYSHVACVPGGAFDCDPTVTEEFQNGGSHAIAINWLAWIVRGSDWGAQTKATAREIMRDILSTRINDKAAADAFACRYLGAPVIRTKKRCR